MTAKPSLTIFPAPDAGGAILAAQIQELGHGKGFECRIEHEFTVRTGMRAQLCDDVVVYDLTTDGRVEGAYRGMSSLHVWLPHVLLVSRTPLPANMLPPRPGGSPRYPFPLESLSDGSPIPRHFASGQLTEWVSTGNQSILNWLAEALTDPAVLDSSPRLQREPSFELMWPYSKPVQDWVRSIHGRLLPAFEHMFQNVAFLSFRGRCVDEALTLSQRVSAGDVTGTDAAALRVILPSELAMEKELMSAGMRWLVVSQLRMRVFSASEFWIYRTPDYLDSWWTLAELAHAEVAEDNLHDLAAEGRDVISISAPTIRVYEPGTGLRGAGSPRTRVRFRKKQRTLLGQITSMTQPGTSSPPFYGPGTDPAPRLPRRMFRERDWDLFWGTLLVDRRAVGLNTKPYDTSIRGLLNGLDDMLHFDLDAVEVAASSGTVAHSREGIPLRIGRLPARLLYNTPSSTNPSRPVLRRVPTYYALP